MRNRAIQFALLPRLSRITPADSSEGILAVFTEKIAAAKTRKMIPLRLDLSMEPAPPDRFHILHTLMT